MAGYYFAFANDDPMRTAYNEAEMSIEEMRKKFVGEFIQTGDEAHDISRVVDIWTQAQANAYYNE
jgi:hypothetical protein